jgi:putative (di)nucleoside polyphosphate hydrolase
MISQDEPDPAYRRCVGVALFNAAGLVFIGRRAGLPDGPDVHAWQMPQGGLDAGEDPLVAARRELAEETGVTSATLLTEAPVWLAYDLPPEARKASWGGRWRGQTQKWFAFRFTGDEREINVLAPPGGHKAEFSDWRWERLAATPALIVPFKRGVYENVAKLFAGFAR